MKKLTKPGKINEKDLAQKLNVVTEEVVVQSEKKKLGRPKKVVESVVEEIVVAPPAPVVDKKAKVTSIADKKAANEKLKAPVVTPPVVAPPQKEMAKALKTPTPVVVDVDEDEIGEDAWEDIFKDVIEGKKFRYVRQDNITLAEMRKNLPKFNIHLLMAEEREDEKFTNMVLCFISADTFTFIDQTGDEDFDSIAQVEHDQIIGQRELKTKKHTFPFAIYIKEEKVAKGK